MTITTEDLRKLLDDMKAMPSYLSEAVTSGDLANRRDEALRLYSRHAHDLAAELITARAKIEAAEKLAEAAKVLTAQDQAIQLRYLQTLVEIAGDKSSTLVFPVPIDILQKWRS